MRKYFTPSSHPSQFWKAPGCHGAVLLSDEVEAGFRAPFKHTQQNQDILRLASEFVESKAERVCRPPLVLAAALRSSWNGVGTSGSLWDTGPNVTTLTWGQPVHQFERIQNRGNCSWAMIQLTHAILCCFFFLIGFKPGPYSYGALEKEGTF